MVWVHVGTVQHVGAVHAGDVSGERAQCAQGHGTGCRDEPGSCLNVWLRAAVHHTVKDAWEHVDGGCGTWLGSGWTMGELW